MLNLLTLITIQFSEVVKEYLAPPKDGGLTL